MAQAGFEAPGLLVVDPTDDRLYVGRSMAAVKPPQRVGVIRRSTMEIEEVDVFFPRPHALAVDPHGARFFAASLGQNSVAWAPLGAEEVDLLNLQGDTHVLVQFAVSPDGRWMVGTGQISGALLVFDLTGEAPQLIRSVPVGGQPWHPSITRRAGGLDPEPDVERGHRRRDRDLERGRRHPPSGAQRAARVRGLAGRAYGLRLVAQRRWRLPPGRRR